MHDLLDDSFSETSRKFELANKNQRLVNHIVDQLVILLAYSAILFFQIVLIPEYFDQGDSGSSGVILDYLNAFIASTVYYTVMEFYMNGQTVGKLVTRTRAVNVDGSSLTFRKALMRSLVRSIPFEALSYLGNKDTGWHDDMTETMVVKNRRF